MTIRHPIMSLIVLGAGSHDKALDKEGMGAG